MSLPKDFKHHKTEVYDQRGMSARNWFAKNFCSKGNRSTNIRVVASLLWALGKEEVEKFANENKLSLTEINEQQLLLTVLTKR